MKTKIFDVFRRTFELDSVDEKISQKNCEKWDSMNHLNLIIELEQEFDLSFEPEEIGEMKSYADIERIILIKSKSL